MRYRSKSKRSRAAVPPPVKGEMTLTLWLGGIGMLAGLAAELIWSGPMLWMTGGGIAGGMAGGVCDITLYHYRRLRRTRLLQRVNPGK